MKMVRISSLILLLGVASLGAKAQGYIIPAMSPHIVAQPGSYGFVAAKKGNYQTIDGVWHQARITLSDTGIYTESIAAQHEDGIYAQPVSADAAAAKNPPISPETIKVIAFRKDTLVILSDPAMIATIVGSSWKAPKLLYANRLLIGADLELLKCVVASQKVGDNGQRQMLRQQGKFITLVPQKKKEFDAYMAAVVGDCPQLSQQVASGMYSAGMADVILRRYIFWKMNPPVSTQ